MIQTHTHTHTHIYLCTSFDMDRGITRNVYCVQLVELKNGDTYNGHLVQCDSWMNMHLKEVICTSKDGDAFWRMPEVYVRGNTVKYLRVPDEILGKAREYEMRRQERRALGRGGRGRGRGGRGRGGGRHAQEVTEGGN